MNTFEKLRDQWLEEVADQCHKYATEVIDLDFYPFQSNVRENPKLLFVGLNPGKNEKYSKKMQEMHLERRTSKELINAGEQNAYIANRDNSDWGPIAKTMCSIFYDNEFFRADFEQAVLMNIYYFNTGQLKDLKNGEIKQFCTIKTRELIDNIVKPKVIIALGNDALVGLQAKNVLFPLKDYKNRNLIKIGERNSVPIIWLPNPSKFTRSYYNDGNKQLITEFLINYFKENKL